MTGTGGETFLDKEGKRAMEHVRPTEVRKLAWTKVEWCRPQKPVSDAALATAGETLSAAVCASFLSNDALLLLSLLCDAR